MPKHEVSKPYFPGYTRKSVTFTIDDGVIETDRKFISVIAPYGIRGTFNLCSDRYHGMDTAPIVEMYRGYEIANHCKYHPYLLPLEKEADIVDQPFDRESADETKLYPHEVDGLYFMHLPKGWRLAARYETYLRLAREGREELEAIFGEGTVKGYAWPYCRQYSDALYEELIGDGYSNIRGSGLTYETTGYAIPENYMEWRFTVTNKALVSQVPVYEAFADDGELKFFCIGVHSKDYEQDNGFDDLAYFARTFGNQPDKYYTAGVGAILHYASCAKALVIGEDSIENPTDTDIYLTVDGKKAVAYAKCTISLDTLEVISRSV